MLKPYPLFWAAALLCLTACAPADTSQIREIIRFTSEMNRDHYTIGKGDVLDVVTWKEPDFTKTLMVSIDGNIRFPLLGDIRAEGRTVSGLEREIGTRLKKYVTTPVVSVFIKRTDSQRFYIMGEISKPGEYPLLKKLTVLQAVALAEGFTEWAAKGDMILIRDENGVPKRYEIDYYQIIEGVEHDSDIVIQADDIIVVP